MMTPGGGQLSPSTVRDCGQGSTTALGAWAGRAGSTSGERVNGATEELSGKAAAAGLGAEPGGSRAGPSWPPLAHPLGPGRDVLPGRTPARSRHAARPRHPVAPVPWGAAVPVAEWTRRARAAGSLSSPVLPSHRCFQPQRLLGPATASPPVL